MKSVILTIQALLIATVFSIAPAQAENKNPKDGSYSVFVTHSDDVTRASNNDILSSGVVDLDDGTAWDEGMDELRRRETLTSIFWYSGFLGGIAAVGYACSVLLGG